MTRFSDMYAATIPNLEFSTFQTHGVCFCVLPFLTNNSAPTPGMNFLYSAFYSYIEYIYPNCNYLSASDIATDFLPCLSDIFCSETALNSLNAHVKSASKEYHVNLNFFNITQSQNKMVAESSLMVGPKCILLFQ